MGGEGSGNFRPHRPTVESCLSLSAVALRRLGGIGDGAVDSTVTWEDGPYGGSSMRLSWDPARAIRLSYSAIDGHRQEEVPWCLLGRRLYFLCPRCQARCDRLHLPSDGERFLCRVCHGLTYESARSFRKPPKWFVAMLRDAGEDDPERERRLWCA